MCGQQHHRLLHGSKLAYASAKVVAGGIRGHKGYRPDWFLGRPMAHGSMGSPWSMGAWGAS